MNEITTVAGYVTISQQLLDQSTFRIGWINHRKTKSQRRRLRDFKAAQENAATAAMFFSRITVPKLWPKDWRRKSELFKFKPLQRVDK